ncbi:mitochondrial 37S ribosomal protein mS45 [Aspergillus stella-maris]|uniref:mitochondrial 37S ribosomal protein mS45 n=1 Tax=Aspergillus stella-maris TaxID=1810926 RepID=UPI003CCE3A28
MPPRIQSQRVSNSLLSQLSSSSSPCTSHQCTTRSFSSSQPTQTQLRQQMFAWLRGEGAALKEHVPGNFNYLTTVISRRQDPERPASFRPFPMNTHFKSQTILSEELRNEIHRRVMVNKQSVRSVSAALSVDVRRVAAVCRLVELEKKMRQEGKPLALPYARTIHEMVKTTPLYETTAEQRENAHESINDLPAHRLTDTQIFYPVSESRQFTRVDAGRVFSAAPARTHKFAAEQDADPDLAITNVTQNPSRIEFVGKGDKEQPVLQPADVRIPHPHLISYARDMRKRRNEKQSVINDQRARIEKEDAVDKERKQAAEAIREANTSHVKPESSRFEFRIKNVEVSKETTGANGRGAQAPGRRYGTPSYERKKGQVKIPTRVVV